MNNFFNLKYESNCQNPANAYYPEPLNLNMDDDQNNGQIYQKSTYPNDFGQEFLNQPQQSNTSSKQNIFNMKNVENLLNLLKGNNSDMLSTMLASSLFGEQKNSMMTEAMSKIMKPTKDTTTQSPNITFEEL